MHDNPCHDRRPVRVMCAGNRVDLRENYEKRHRKYVLSPQPGSYRARIVPENTTTTPTRSSHKEDATLKITRTRTWTLRRVAYSTTGNQQQFEGNSSRQLSELSVAGSVDSQFSFSQSVGSKQARADDSRRNSIDSGTFCGLAPASSSARSTLRWFGCLFCLLSSSHTFRFTFLFDSDMVRNRSFALFFHAPPSGDRSVSATIIIIIFYKI